MSAAEGSKTLPLIVVQHASSSPHAPPIMAVQQQNNKNPPPIATISAKLSAPPPPIAAPPAAAAAPRAKAAPSTVASAATPAAAPTQSSSSSVPGSGSKRPLTTTDKDGNQLSEKKLRRLAKNRLSARECRRRKREATENLQRQINVLEGENLRLRLQLQIGEEAEESMTREQCRLTEEIDALLKSGASEAEIYAALESFKEKYADYGRDRRSAIEFHLRNVERLLMPTQTTSVVMRAMEGGSQQSSNSAVAAAAPTNDAGEAAPSTTAAADSSANPLNLQEPKSLFQCLVTHLEVSQQQAAALKDSRFVAQELDGCLEQALKVVKELRERLAQTGEDLETEFNNVRNVLSPTQAAKFLVWVANNSAAMHMLNELWDRIYPSGAPPAAPVANTPSEGGGAAAAGDETNSDGTTE